MGSPPPPRAGDREIGVIRQATELGRGGGGGAFERGASARLALVGAKPRLRISGSTATCPGSAQPLVLGFGSSGVPTAPSAASAAASGAAAKRAGVARLTAASVVCADRVTATRS